MGMSQLEWDWLSQLGWDGGNTFGSFLRDDDFCDDLPVVTMNRR